MPVTTVAGMPCDFCGEEFDPIATRWLCPHCHAKANCCDGAPLRFCEAPAAGPERHTAGGVRTAEPYDATTLH